MSCATPEKRRERVLGLAHSQQGLASGHPSPIGTMVPTVPMVRRCRRASQAASRPVSSFERRDSARASSVGRDHRGRWSRRMLVRRGGADRETQTAITPLTPGALTRKDKRPAREPLRRGRGSVYSGE